MNYFLNWQDHAGSQAEKFYKTTLWQGEHVMVGLNCLEPGQTQKSTRTTARTSSILYWPVTESLLSAMRRKRQARECWWLRRREFRTASPTSAMNVCRCWSRSRRLSNERSDTNESRSLEASRSSLDISEAELRELSSEVTQTRDRILCHRLQSAGVSRNLSRPDHRAIRRSAAAGRRRRLRSCSTIAAPSSETAATTVIRDSSATSLRPATAPGAFADLLRFGAQCKRDLLAFRAGSN